MKTGLRFTLAAALTLLFFSARVQAANFTVNIRNNFFTPANLTINVGDTVTWVQQGFNHNTESFDPPGLWASDILNAGETFSFTFSTAGTFRYKCNPHSATMRGTIVVQAAANTPPTVSISQPANGAVFTAPASVTVAATASDSNGTIAQVEFFDGTTSLGVDISSPYSVAATLSAGSHTLTAKATDNAGASTTSSPVTVTVNAANTPPSVNISSPVDGAVFSAPATFQVRANAADNDGNISKVEFLSGRSVVGTVTSPPYVITLNDLAAGSYSLSARATDNAGAVTTSAGVSVTVTAANSPPTVSLISPTNNATFNAPATITLEAAAADTNGTIAQVEFFSGQNLLGADTSAPFSLTLTNVAPGTLTFTAKATDNAGASTISSPITITVNASSAPRFSISSPSKLANRQFQFSITGTAGQSYAIQASTNLIDWVTVRTATAPSSTFTFVDTEAATLNQRFYRVIQP